MELSIFQHWDPLRICMIGKTYPPEFYKFISNSSIRSALEKISQETEDDLQNLEKKLKSFDVSVIRPSLKDNLEEYRVGKKYLPPPLTPRDDFAVIGNRFFMPTTDDLFHWRLLEQPDWKVAPPRTEKDWNDLPESIKDNFGKYMNIHSVDQLYYRDYSGFKIVEQLANTHGNEIIYNQQIDSAMICRIGKDLYSGTWPGQDKKALRKKLETLFPDYRCHIIETNGHLDGVFCPVKEGLILANHDLDLQIFYDNFPGWEIQLVEYNNTDIFKNYQSLKRRNMGKWWVPGEENNHEFTDFVETYINNWVGFIEETSVGVNVLIVDENNVLCTQEDSAVFKKLEQHGITPHLVPFRHYNFWDSGLHCLTTDISRIGTMRDYFPERAMC